MTSGQKKKGGVATALSQIAMRVDQAMIEATTPAPKKFAVSANVADASITR